MHVTRDTIILSGVAVAVVASVMLYHRFGGDEGPIPEGLLQVSGRIEGDRISVSSKYAGRITRLLVREGDPVALNQPLVRLDDDETRAKLDQARAGLLAAVSQAEGATESVSLTAETGSAIIRQAEAALGQAEGAVVGARADAIRAHAAIETAQATERSAEANVATARAGVRAAEADHDRALATQSTAESELAAARATAKASEAAIEASKAALDRAASDARRYRVLFDQQAISEQMMDQATAAERAARAQVESATEQAAAAKSAIGARQAAVRAAASQADAAQANVTQARAQVGAARQQAAATAAGVHQAEAQYRAQQSMVTQAAARLRQAAGGLSQARTADRQVAVSRTSRAQANARTAQARAALREIEAVLRNFEVRSPAAGTVSTRMVDTGEVVSAGAPLLDLVDLDQLYLKVYVPENLIGKLRLGQDARIYVDALPEKFFEATVRYISSTAEFTPKEVQTVDERVKLVFAVKLYLKTNPGRALTPGMPADAIIRWKEDVPWRKPRW